MGLEIKTFDLIFQIVNFAILFIILKKFLFSAFLKSVEKEQTNLKVTKEKMEEIDKRVLQMEEESGKSRAKTAEESKKILEDAKNSAEKIRLELKNKAQEESKELLEEAKKEIENQKIKMGQELKQDLAKIVETSLHKLNLTLSKEDKEKTVKEAVSKLANER